MSATDFITVPLVAQPPRADRKQWVHYLPSGTFALKDGRGPYQLDDPQGFIKASFRRSGGHPILVDFDHALEAAASEARTPAPAAGWISELSAKPDGIWGLTEWTPRAAEHLAAKEYRFVSPVFRHTVEGGVVMSLTAAALTNQPALTSLTAVCSMERTKMPMDMEGLCSALRPLLGLTDTAEPDAIVEAVRALQTRAVAASVSPPRDKFVPMEEFIRVTSALNAASRGVSEQAAETVVAAAIETGKLVPAMREWGVALCTENKPAFDDFVSRASGGLQKLFTPLGLQGRTPPQSGRVSALEREMAERCGLSVDDLK